MNSDGNFGTLLDNVPFRGVQVEECGLLLPFHPRLPRIRGALIDT